MSSFQSICADISSASSTLEDSSLEDTLGEDLFKLDENSTRAITGSPGLFNAGRWSKQEDDDLTAGVKQYGCSNWKTISEIFLKGQRSDVQCLHRWQKVLRPGLRKGKWTDEEDETIRRCLNQGMTKWKQIAELVTGRIGKQCRERWYNHLDPSVNKHAWTAEEDARLDELQAQLGNKWSEIAKLMEGRPENAVKNRWNSSNRLRSRPTKENSKPTLAAPSSDTNSRKRDSPVEPNTPGTLNHMDPTASPHNNESNSSPNWKDGCARPSRLVVAKKPRMDSLMDSSLLDCGSPSLRSPVFGDITPCGTPSAGMSPLRLKPPFGAGDRMFQSLFGLSTPRSSTLKMEQDLSGIKGEEEEEQPPSSLNLELDLDHSGLIIEGVGMMNSCFDSTVECKEDGDSTDPAPLDFSFDTGLNIQETLDIDAAFNEMEDLGVH